MPATDELKPATIQRLQDSVVPAFAPAGRDGARPLHPARRRGPDPASWRPGSASTRTACRGCSTRSPRRACSERARPLPQRPRSRRVPGFRTAPLPRRLARDPGLDLVREPAHRRVDPHRRARGRARLERGRPGANRGRPPRPGPLALRLRPGAGRAARPLAGTLGHRHRRRIGNASPRPHGALAAAAGTLLELPEVLDHAAPILAAYATAAGSRSRRETSCNGPSAGRHDLAVLRAVLQVMDRDAARRASATPPQASPPAASS